MEIYMKTGFMDPKNCIIVTRKGKRHVRRYSHDVKNGMSGIEAGFICAYDNMPSFSPFIEERNAANQG